MKKENSILATILLLLLTGCGGDKHSNDDAFITVDVTKNYPKKELILQDIADVEYIPLETTDEFINRGLVRSVTDNHLAIRLARQEEIMIYDRLTGKALHKISKRGQGAGEYIFATKMVVDDERQELYVRPFRQQKILVYDLAGNYKRDLVLPKNTPLYLNYMFNYDRDHLFCSNAIYEEPEDQVFWIISKQDGSFVREIVIPFEKKIAYPLITPEGYLLECMHSAHPIIPFRDQFIIEHHSADTIYRYLPKQDHPVPMIARTPSIQSMNPHVILFLEAITEGYYFMNATKLEAPPFPTPDKLFAFESFPSKKLVYCKKDKAIYEYTMYNADIDNQTEVILTQVDDKGGYGGDIMFWYRFEAYKLVELYKKGELKGRLKEIAAELDEEDNPVIMVVKHKK
ncbi:MAG: 6-bladed beta-propeller [Tannerella sp.]|jgi:hypothetical protein|nr:6-bladed beta-propeller [Tannerella sp.]